MEHRILLRKTTTHLNGVFLCLNFSIGKIPFQLKMKGMISMAIIQVKKYKTIKDENGNKIQVPKTPEEWNKETRNGTKTWYFSTRYEINGKKKQYKSKLFALKREAQDDERLFLNNPIEYIRNNSKRAKNSIEIIQEKSYISKTLEDYFKDFIEYELKHNKGATAYAHKTIWDKHILDDFGNYIPSQITFELTQEWHKKIDTKINDRTGSLYSTSSKNTFHSTLSNFFQYLFHIGKLHINYAKVIGSFKDMKKNINDKEEIKFQTIEQFQLFMEVVNDDFWYTFFNFLFWHGCRKGEQRALKIKDVDFKHNTIYFHNTFSRNKDGAEEIGPIKNWKARTTYLAEQSIPYLVKLINFYKQMDGYSDDWFLFGGPFSTYKNRIDDKLKYYYKKLINKYPNKEINILTHHEFGRHSHASFLLNIGSDREDIYFIIAERLGDTIEVIRSTYAKPYESLNIDKSKQLLSIENINQKLNAKGENVT